MSNWRELAADIDSVDWLYLRETTTTSGWGLRVVVEEVVPMQGPENLERDFEPALASRLRSEMDANPRPVPRAFEISFSEAICYLVQNETYGEYPKPPETFTGKLFRIFTTSHLLDLVKQTTYVREDHPGPETPQHFSIVCQDDVVDVIACTRPQIRRIAPES